MNTTPVVQNDYKAIVKMLLDTVRLTQVLRMKMDRQRCIERHLLGIR